MSFLVCIVPVSSMRAEPSHRSEQVSQLLFGETAEIIVSEKDFTLVKCIYDGYRGWCQSAQLVTINEDISHSSTHLMSAQWTTNITLNSNAMLIPFGSCLSVFNNEKVKPYGFDVEYNGALWDNRKSVFDEESIRKLAFKYLNSSYLWGGRSVFGVDCSGFCQTVFKFLNIPLLRDASQQATQGEAIGFLQEARCGDLAFFDNDEGKITHVGILLDTGSIIHSSGKVRVDAINDQGIVNSDSGKHSHALRTIRRIVPITNEL